MNQLRRAILAGILLQVVLVAAAGFLLSGSARWVVASLAAISLAALLSGRYEEQKQAKASAALQTANESYRREIETVLSATENAQRALANSIEISQRITSILELDILLSQVPALIERRFNLYAARIHLLNDQAKDGLLTDGNQPASRSKIVQRAITWCAECRRHYILSRSDEDNAWQEETDLLETHWLLALPLVFGGQFLGVLELRSRKDPGFQPDIIPYLELLADQVATAIRNASLYQQVDRFNQDLEQQIHQRTLDMQKTYEQLERLDKAKSDFVALASHELRTPLTVVQGYSQMLLDEPEIKSNNRYNMLVEGIFSGVHRLLEIIESLLDVAKIDNRELVLYPTPLSLQSLMKSIQDRLGAEAAERGIQISQDLADLPSIQGDLDGLRKVFYHLIINAIKFTPDGGRVTISGREVSLDHLNSGQPGVEIIVQDSGIGISPQNQELIFYKFFSPEKVMLHSTGRTKFKGKGAGLGLAIAKGIVEAHRGKIWVESPGYNEADCPGSSFHVMLPKIQERTVRRQE